MIQRFTPLRRFLLCWNVVNVVLFALIVRHRSTAPEILGRYTKLYLGGIGLSLALVIGVLVFSIWGERWALTWVRRLSGGWGIVLALGLLVATTAFRMLNFDAEFIKLLVTFNTACFGLWIVFAVPVDDREEQRRLWQWLLVGGLAVLLLIGFFSAHRVPLEESAGDEPTWTDIGITWLHTGEAYNQVSAVTPEPITPGLGYWITVLAEWTQVFGISLASGRLFMWLLSVLAALAIGVAGSRLYDRWVGLFAGILAAASLYLLSYRIVRPDIGLPLCCSLILLLYLSKRPSWSLLAGWVAVLSLEFHAAGLAYIAGVGGVYVTDLVLHRSDPLRFKRLIYFMIGGAIGSAVYVALHILILPDPAYYFQYLRGQRGFLGESDYLGWLQSSFQLYWDRSPLEVIFTALALLGLVMRRTPSDRFVLRIWVLCFIGYVFLVPQFFRYLVFFSPFICIGLAALVRYAFDRVASAPRLAGSGIVLLSLCGPFLAVSLPSLSPNVLAPDPMPAQVERVRALSDPSALVAGDMNDYWWFQDYAAFYGNGAEYEHAAEISQGDTSLWSKLHPDIIFFTALPGNPTMLPLIKQWLHEGQYVLSDSVKHDGFTTLIWERPGYHPPS